MVSSHLVPLASLVSQFGLSPDLVAHVQDILLNRCATSHVLIVHPDANVSAAIAKEISNLIKNSQRSRHTRGVRNLISRFEGRSSTTFTQSEYTPNRDETHTVGMTSSQIRAANRRARRQLDIASNYVSSLQDTCKRLQAELDSTGVVLVDLVRLGREVRAITAEAQDTLTHLDSHVKDWSNVKYAISLANCDSASMSPDHTISSARHVGGVTNTLMSLFSTSAGRGLIITNLSALFTESESLKHQEYMDTLISLMKARYSDVTVIGTSTTPLPSGSGLRNAFGFIAE